MMKRILVLNIIFICFANVCYSQQKLAISECLKVENLEDSIWLRRYEKDIIKMEQEDKLVLDSKCDVLFLGSSSFRMWKTMKEDFAPLTVFNRGYGGASIRDMLYNYPRLISAYQPRKIVYYSENDIIGSNKDIAISETFDLCRVFLERLHKDFPAAHLYVLSVKPSFARKELLPKHGILNILLKEYAEQAPFCTFLDVSTPLLDSGGKLRPELYLDDKLHLNNQGYAIWTGIIKPCLMDN